MIHHHAKFHNPALRNICDTPMSKINVATMLAVMIVAYMACNVTLKNFINPQPAYVNLFKITILENYGCNFSFWQFRDTNRKLLRVTLDTCLSELLQLNIGNTSETSTPLSYCYNFDRTVTMLHKMQHHGS
jgi:hypothetical protein